MNVALHAPDAVPVDRGALARGPRIALHPSVTLLRSPWPVDAIWRANQPEVVDDRVEVDGGGVDIQVWRAGDDVLMLADDDLREQLTAIFEQAESTPPPDG